jgi:hypothetical protein
MGKSFAKGLFYVLSVILVVWTASLTYSFVASVLPNAHWLVPVFALVVFDAGMIAWLVVFLDYARGTGQRAVALTLCIIDFLGVGLMVLAEIFLGGQTIVNPPENLGEYAVWGLGIWTVINVGGVIVFHLLHPETRKKMAIRSEMDAVFDEALGKLKTKRAGISGALSDELSEGLLTQLIAELASDADHDGTLDIFQRGAARPETRIAQPAASNNGEQPDPLQTR